MNDQITIIRANKRHLSQINSVIRHVGLQPVLKKDTTLKLWAAKVHGKIVGCCALGIHRDGTVLHKIAVRRDYWHGGIGSALIKAIEEYSDDSGAKWIALCSMYYRFNFYKKRGFKTCPRAALPDAIRDYHQFLDPKFMKCAVMYKLL